MEINWNLIQPVDTGALAQQGFAAGMALTKHIQTQHALSAYMANPDDPQAASALAAYAPETLQTMQKLRSDQEVLALKRQQLAATQAAGTQAAGGDYAGAQRTALQSGDIDLAEAYNKLSDSERKKNAEFWQAATPLAYKLKQIADPAQRRALFEAAKPQLLATGVPEATINQFDPTNETQLDGVLATGQKISDLIEQGKIVWHQQGEQPSFATDAMGNPVGKDNPYAHGGAPAPAPAHAPPPADRPPPPDMHNVAALGSTFGTVTSTKRSPEHNREVGGVSNSYHLTGHAIDIVPKPGVTREQIVHGFEKAGYHVLEQLDEGDHIHIALSGGAAPANSQAAIRAAAEKAISMGADPAKVRERAKAQGVEL